MWDGKIDKYIDGDGKILDRWRARVKEIEYLDPIRLAHKGH